MCRQIWNSAIRVWRRESLCLQTSKCKHQNVFQSCRRWYSITHPGEISVCKHQNPNIIFFLQSCPDDTLFLILVKLLSANIKMQTSFFFNRAADDTLLLILVMIEMWTMIVIDKKYWKDKAQKFKQQKANGFILLL